MLRFRSQKLSALFGFLLLAGLAGGASSAEAAVELSPSELIFASKGEAKTITITNLGPNAVEIEKMASGSTAFFPYEACKGSILPVKGFCNETVECVKEGVNAYFTIWTSPPVHANATLMKC